MKTPPDTQTKARFYYLVCQFGAEKTAKAEVLETYPELKFAFSRPGFVTFKEPELSAPLRAWNRDWIFVRVWGLSRGQATTADAALGLEQEFILPDAQSKSVECFDRDTWVPGDEPDGWRLGSRCQEAVERWELRSATPVVDRNRASSARFQWIWMDPDRLFLGEVPVPGTKLPPQGRHLAPGNLCPIELDSRAPSRAYLKLAEAFVRFGADELKNLKGKTALEIGCSPGGATFWMLSHGMQVLGVDPKRSNDVVDRHPLYRHILKLAKTVQESDLQGFNPEWIVMDMNLKPLEALDELAHVLKLLKKVHAQKMNLKKGFLTIKLNDWKLAVETPGYLKRLESLGFHVRSNESGVFQLASNRQEFGVVAEFRVR